MFMQKVLIFRNLPLIWTLIQRHVFIVCKSAYVSNTVNLEIFARILFSQKALKDIFAM